MSEKVRHEEDPECLGRLGETALEGRIAAERLHVQREDEDQPEEARVHRCRRDVDRAEQAVLVEAQGEHRFGDPQLDDDQCDAGADPHQREREGARVRPAALGRGRECVQQHADRGDRQHETGEVEPARSVLASLPEPDHREHEGDRSDRTVDQEDPAP